MTLTVAPGSAAPVPSFTNPEMTLVPVWLNAGWESPMPTISAKITRTNRDATISASPVGCGFVGVSRATDREKRSNRGNYRKGLLTGLKPACYMRSDRPLGMNRSRNRCSGKPSNHLIFDGVGPSSQVNARGSPLYRPHARPQATTALFEDDDSDPAQSGPSEAFRAASTGIIVAL